MPVKFKIVDLQLLKKKISISLPFCLFRHSGGFRWTSGQCGPLNSNALTNSNKKNKENRLQKVKEKLYS